jgi:hypothetical protein
MSQQFVEEKPRIFRSSVDHKYRYFAGTPALTKHYEAAGIVNPYQDTAVDLVNVLNQVIGLEQRQYRLREMCQVIPMDPLKMTLDIAEGFPVQKKVPPLVSADLKKLSWSNVDFDLWKNEGKVMVSLESQLKSRHPQMQIHIQQCAVGLAEAENEQIAEVAETCTEKVSSATYADWGATTAGVSNANPLPVITAHINAIEKVVKLPVDVFALHPTLFDKFIANTNVRNLVWAGMAKFNETERTGTFKLPGRPQVRVITDFNLTETPDSDSGPILASTAAYGLVLGEGPTMGVQYTDNDIHGEVYDILQFLEPKLVRDTAMSKICT